ncbi:MAG: hypothetical protein HY319_15100 [Armatimonadetes bacterium]|nr:hypothetical protein [Armatimonadota bacterium]
MDDERLVGIIPQVAEVKGFLGMSTDFMTLVVTNRRLILAEQPSEMNDQHTDLEWKIEELIKEQETTWKEFMGSHDFSEAPWMKYWKMDPDSILAEEASNRCFTFQAIDDAVLEPYSDEGDHMDSIKIKAGGAYLDLSLPWGNGREAHKILAAVMNLSVVQGE